MTQSLIGRLVHDHDKGLSWDDTIDISTTTNGLPISHTFKNILFLIAAEWCEYCLIWSTDILYHVIIFKVENSNAHVQTISYHHAKSYANTNNQLPSCWLSCKYRPQEYHIHHIKQHSYHKCWRIYDIEKYSQFPMSNTYFLLSGIHWHFLKSENGYSVLDHFPATH